MTFVEVLVKVKYFHRNDKVFQHFICEGKNKHIEYIKSPQYKIYTNFGDKIKKLSLTNKGYEFLNKRDEKNRIVLEFEDTKKEKIENTYFVISGFIPDRSCSYCKYRRNVFCDFMGKAILEQKTCKFFMEK